MSNNNLKEGLHDDQLDTLPDTPDPSFSYELLRHLLLPELLGEEEESILYWAGKTLARKQPLSTVEEIQAFFYKAQWGVLKVLKEKKNEQTFELAATKLTREHAPVSLEAGFLAEQYQIQRGCYTEAAYELKKKKPLTFHIIVKWDPKDTTE
ncbi:DUF2507 domain-containing protein [Alteribacter populi]|uniref:DUF2507 domain-containing protein n=1 Tax=Alteribacter populi TaxID=2011011 RepID=UPI000BBB32FC|nr:DUF2507 domain-containing protein [Alteribacter populi]